MVKPYIKHESFTLNLGKLEAIGTSPALDKHRQESSISQEAQEKINHFRKRHY